MTCSQHDASYLFRLLLLRLCLRRLLLLPQLRRPRALSLPRLLRLLVLGLLSPEHGLKKGQKGSPQMIQVPPDSNQFFICQPSYRHLMFSSKSTEVWKEVSIHPREVWLSKDVFRISVRVIWRIIQVSRNDSNLAHAKGSPKVGARGNGALTGEERWPGRT